MPALNFPASSSSPWTAPNGVIYTWNTDGYWEAKADPNDFDTDYLKLNATNDPVTGNLALDQDLDVGDNLAVTGTSAFTGLTTHADGVKVTGGDGSEKLTITSAINGTTYSLYLHSLGCARLRTYVGNGLDYKRFTLSSGNKQSEKGGRAVDFVVGPNQEVTGNSVGTLLSFYSPSEDYEDDKETSVSSTIIQSIAGTDADYVENGNSRPVMFRMSKNGTLSAGKYITPAVFNYKLNGVTGDAYFAGKLTTAKDVSARRLDLSQYATIPGSDPTSTSNQCIILGTNVSNSIYCDLNAGKNRIWFNGADGSSYHIGSRSGSQTLDAIILNATSITANGSPLSTFTPVSAGVAAAGITNAVTTVKSLLPHAGGFDATQLQSVLPEAFSTNEVIVDADTNETETVNSYDQTKLIPLLTKALQEALERIEALEAQLNP